MKISLNWLKEYVDINVSNAELQNRFNLMSQEVAGFEKLVDATNLVIGHVLECVKHPQADKLSVCQVDVGNEKLQIICGAPNVATGQKVIVALNGAVLPGDIKIKKAKIRGVESNGMICSLAELGIQEFDAKELGIYVLGDDAVIGNDPLAYLHMDDYVLDLDLTANRADLLSYRGVAYDTACLLNTETHLHKHEIERERGNAEIEVFTQTHNCYIYYGQVVRNIKIKPSPAWMKSRLIASGIRPISNVVDITNYIMLEYGQPLHAFDYDKINGQKIVVRMANKDETIRTLDNQERKLLESDIVITDSTKPIALAGVMGGLETEIDDNSKTILLEAAIFEPIHVRKTSKRLGLKSESSTRFERGVVPSWTKEALDRACVLLAELADAEIVEEPSFFNNVKVEKNIISLSIEKLRLVSGYDFREEQVEEILDRLQFKYRNKDNVYHIEVPDRRQNFFSYQDIVEEIVRIFGYDKIPATIPTTPTQGYLSEKQYLRRTIRNYFVGHGFHETKTYSLTTEGEATLWDSEKKPVVQIMNPIHSDRNTLRHSIIPALLNVLVYNKSRKIEDLSLFETGKCYVMDDEVELLSGLMYGRSDYSLWQGNNQKVDFYWLKGIVDALFRTLKIEDVTYKTSDKHLADIHPGIHADIYIGEEYIGFTGRLHPQKEHELGIGSTFLFELNLDKITEYANKEIMYTEIPKFPSVKRDLALIINRDIPASRIIEEVKVAGKKTLINVDIFDVYQDEKILDEKKSVALTLELQNVEKTLETSEVETVIARILKHLEKTLDARLRQ